MNKMKINDMNYKKRYLHFFAQEIVISKILTEKLKIRRNKKDLFCGTRLPDVNETNRIIYDAIVSQKPFAFIRPGNAELSEALEWEEVQLFGRRIYNRKSENWNNFIKTYGDDLDKYNMLFRQDVACADIFAVFSESYLNGYIVERYCSNAKIVSMSNYCPIQAEKPWTDALKGKKVLVVSQFSDYLLEQYNKREEIYKGHWVWPEFELIPVKSVWFFSKKQDNRFDTWFDALDYLYNEIMKYDFDIALLSCGPFAINLAAMIKRAGKQAIQYAGELQMLFGIKGARWDDNSFFKQYYNDSWIRVSKKQAGIENAAANGLDEGCYW